LINRFEWIKAVLRSGLLDRAKVVAASLALENFNEETGQCNPNQSTIADNIGRSLDTVKRGLEDLAKAGWLVHVATNGRGNWTGYVLTSPGNIVLIRPAKKSVHDANSAVNAAARGGQRSGASLAKGGSAAKKGGQRCFSHIRKEQSSEQKAGGRPRPDLAVEVEAGSWKAMKWNGWIADNGYRTDLRSLSALQTKGGNYLLPWGVPPHGAGTQAAIAKKVIEWAMEARNAAAA
jgi:hypothetical protein